MTPCETLRADVLVVPFLVENNKLEFNHQVDISRTKGAKPRIRLEMRIRLPARWDEDKGERTIYRPNSRHFIKAGAQINAPWDDFDVPYFLSYSIFSRISFNGRNREANTQA
jgi:hypothetical protein